MIGPVHYRRAEASLKAAAQLVHDSPEQRYHLAVAQVHATLALAATSAAANGWTSMDSDGAGITWDQVALNE